MTPQERQAEDDLVERRSGRPVTTVHADGWDAQVRGDEIADIAYRGAPLLRAIRPVVRDRDWNTVPVRAVATDATAASMTARLSFDDGEIVAAATLTLQVDAEHLHVVVDIEFADDCETNRVGLVVLHRPDDAGTRVEVRHSDGSVEHGSWPATISPHQPFRDVTGFAWERDGVRASLALTGDVFESEDQRNWTDASFKTYSTPLDRPFPVRRRAGAIVHQEARLSVTPASGVVPGAPSPASVSDSRPSEGDVVTVLDEAVSSVPPISLGAALYPPPESPSVLADEAGLYESVLLELTGDEARWPDLLAAAAAQADALACPLDVRIVTDDPGTVDRWVRRLPADVRRIGAFDRVGHISAPPLAAALVGAARDTAPDADLLVGTRAHFTELNRRVQDLPRGGDALAFSLTPQMHAGEVPHIIDSLAMQRLVALDATLLAGGRPLVVGPVTLARRFNAVATSGPADLPEWAGRGVDDLLGTRFAAAWTLASVRALAVEGVAALCYYETHGPRGVLDDRGRRPVGDLLRNVAGRRRHSILRTAAPADLAVLATRHDGVTTVSLADLSGRDRQIRLRVPLGDPVLVALPAWETRHLASDGARSTAHPGT